MRHLETERGEKKVKLWRAPVRKDALNGVGCEFFLGGGFQMCELSCCLSLRWSLAHFWSLNASLGLFCARTSVDRSRSRCAVNVRKKEAKPHQCGRTEQPTTKGISSSLKHSPDRNLPFFKQTSEATSLFSAFAARMIRLF